MTPHVRPSVKSDCRAVASRLRDADRAECELWGLDPEASMSVGFQFSIQPMTLIGPSGKPAAMFGVTTGGSDATIWLLGTDEITRFPVTFLRQSKAWIEHLVVPVRNSGFRGIGNWVDMRNTKHVNWLLWVGFTLTSTNHQNGNEIGYFRKAL
jgi:hypothetical protein